ncbi:MAG: 4Fe-4S binding protein [Deltaproteobacteria bacterium]|nr:4Fe-4S binding protein [Deltaproteobacteria bacterium]MBN2687781.1 4Fe-4S binding protein [Deltaproteobacteria bacterium]
MFSKKIIIHYSADIVDQPIVHRLVKDYDLSFNILKARIFPRREGLLVLDLSGTKENFDRGIQYLKKTGVTVEPLSDRVIQNEDKCVHCGACVAFCPTGALYIDIETFKVLFDAEKCTGCELCVTACPPRAMEVNLF